MMGEGIGRRGAFISILLFPLPLMMIDMIGCLIKVCETLSSLNQSLKFRRFKHVISNLKILSLYQKDLTKNI